MCGICGFTGEVLDRDEVIKRMTDVITHRGPDSSGVFAGDGVTMGFRRLSIIDVGNTGDQPIYNEDRTLVLTFNGEIYNYQDLRKELLEKGHKFYTNTDSEVLVHGFEEWQEGLLGRLRGLLRRLRGFHCGLRGRTRHVGHFHMAYALRVRFGRIGHGNS